MARSVFSFRQKREETDWQISVFGWRLIEYVQLDY